MTLTKIAKIVVIIVMAMMATGEADAKKTNNNEFDWNSVMDAITYVESRGNPNAVNGNNCGAMQITPGLVQDCNKILKRRGIDKRYTLKDRFNVKKSREMFVLIMSHYNPTNDIERGIRMWNGGCCYKVKSTQRYYQKVMAQLRKIENA